MQGGKEARTITCVVADDHAVLRQGLVALLSAEDDITVLGSAKDGDDALALIAEHRPMVAIVDLGLPGANGAEIAERTETPIIIYTGRDELKSLEDALASGVRGYVLKCGPSDDIVRAVRMVVAGMPFIDPAMAGGLLKRRLHGDNLLSNREGQVLRLLAEGMTTEAVGRKLFLSPTTVRSHAEGAMRKLEARNRVHAVATALRLGLFV